LIFDNFFNDLNYIEWVYFFTKQKVNNIEQIKPGNQEKNEFVVFKKFKIFFASQLRKEELPIELAPLWPRAYKLNKLLFYEMSLSNTQLSLLPSLSNSSLISFTSSIIRIFPFSSSLLFALFVYNCLSFLISSLICLSLTSLFQHSL
jgi:hypothetical protein